MEYFIIENGQQTGPFSHQQLALKHIKPDTLVWAQGMADWTPASLVDDLKQVLADIEQATQNQAGTGVPPVPPRPMEDDTNNGAYNNGKRKPNHHLGLKITGGVLVVLFLIMAFTNPSRDDHRKAVKDEIARIVDKASSDMDEGNIFEQGIKAFAQFFSQTITNVAFDELFEYHNYVIFSKGTVNVNDEEHTVSYGILGNVYTINADDAIKAIEGTNNSSDLLEDKAAEEGQENESEASTNKNDSTSHSGSLEDKANQAIDKISNKVSKKVEEKINQKIDELTDSSTIDKILNKIFG